MKKVKAARLLAGLLACLVCGTASAQFQRQEGDGYRLAVAAEKPDAMYAQGEEVRFVITLTRDGRPVSGKELPWTVTKDTWDPQTSGTVRLRDGKAVLGGYVLREPGCWQCTVQFETPGGSDLIAMAGATVDPEKIAPSMPEPGDFMAYWKRELRKQAKIPLNIRLTPGPSDDPSIEVFDCQADCEAGNFSAYIARPKGAVKGSLPAMVTLNGAGVRGSRADWTVYWAKEGMIVLDFNVHGLPNGRPDSYYQELDNGALKNYIRAGRDDRDSMFFHEMVMRLIRAIDIIAAQPQWDGKHLIAYGCSQGGAQAVMAGCLDPRVKLVCAEIPAMCDHTGMAADRASGWPKLVTCSPDGTPDARRLRAARYYDVVNFARHVTVPAYVTAGIIDSVCPPTSVYAMYNQLRGEKHILRHLTTGHALTAEGLDYTRAAVRRYLDAIRKSE